MSIRHLKLLVSYLELTCFTSLMPLLYAITHGVTGSNQSNFIPSLVQALNEKGVKNFAPSYPNSSDPDFDEWKQVFHEYIAEYWTNNEDIILVAHSLGGYFALRLIGECSEEEWARHLKGVVLVAPTSMKRPERRKFYSEEVKWDNIHQLPIKVILLYSNDDEKVARMHQDLIIEKIGDLDGFEFREPQNWNHFMTTDCPPVMEAVMSFVEQ